jgi:uncharacterized protein YeaO (DUF488 family)
MEAAMIKIKHFLEAVEQDDGERMWIEPIGLTRELREWCQIGRVASHLGPPMELWNWFDEHPQGYEFFRGKYHEHLAAGPYRAALIELAYTGLHGNLTLVHHGDDPQHNTATALYEYISELSAYCPPEP